MKKQIMGIGIIGIFLLAGITTAFERSENITITKETDFSSFEEEDRYYDVYIFVFGRCECIASANDNSDQKWEGGLYIGFLSLAYASIYGGIEWMFILIHNKSSTERYFRKVQLGVNCLNTSGIFFWGSKGGYSPIPPRIFILCHAEMVRICQDWDE